MSARLVMTALAASIALLACRGASDPTPAPAAEGSAAPAQVAEGSAHAEGSSQAAVPQAEPTPEPTPQRVLPPEVEVQNATASADVGGAGGTLTAGDMTVVIPQGALDRVWTFDIATVASADELEAELPGGLVLGAWRGEPWNPLFARPVELTLPLSRQLEPGTEIEILAWHPQMRSWLVVGRGWADEDGTSVTTTVRQLGEMIARGLPVQRDLATSGCDGRPLGLHDAWPGAPEEDVVGLTEVSDRIPREVAFNLLSDMRLSPELGNIEFKNEEVNDLTGTRRNERDHQDEDFLFDPNAAAATLALARMVRDEWADPYTGEPTHRLRVTEAYDNFIEHSERSTHYQGRAVDMTVTPIPAPAPDARREWFGRLSRMAVCAGFDYVLFENQFHVHASVQPTSYAFVLADGEQRTVTTASLPRPDDRRPSGVAFAAADVEVAGFDYVGPDLFELTGAAGSNERYTLTRSGLQPSQPRPAAQPAGAVPAALPGGGVTADGMRRIVVRDGRAWLVNTGQVPPLGSVDAEGRPVHIEYPYPISLPDEVVLDASFRRHERTTEQGTSP